MDRRDWIEAGGACCVVLNGNWLRERSVKSLWQVRVLVCASRSKAGASVVSRNHNGRFHSSVSTMQFWMQHRQSKKLISSTLSQKHKVNLLSFWETVIWTYIWEHVLSWAPEPSHKKRKNISCIKWTGQPTHYLHHWFSQTSKFSLKYKTTRRIGCIKSDKNTSHWHSKDQSRVNPIGAL